MVICFDGDRTLWDLTYDYEDCFKDLKQWMSDEVDIQITLPLIRRSVFENLKEYNHPHRSNFPLSVMKSFYNFYVIKTGTTPDEELLSNAFRIGDRIYDNLPMVKDTANKVLSYLQDEYGYPLVLITAGDVVIQNSKIFSTGIEDFFFETRIVSNKTVDTYLSTYDDLIDIYDGKYKEYCSSSMSDFVMIGDSINNDINPALDAGWHAIYIPSIKEESEKLTYSDRLYVAKSLNDIPSIIAQIRNDLYDNKNRQM